MKLRSEHQVYVRSMGKLLRITAICIGDDAANLHMRRSESDAVIAIFGELVFLADKHDRGERDATTLLRQIQDALGTGETGAALVEVARDAHAAEMELAAIRRTYAANRVNEGEDS